MATPACRRTGIAARPRMKQPGPCIVSRKGDMASSPASSMRPIHFLAWHAGDIQRSTSTRGAFKHLRTSAAPKGRVVYRLHYCSPKFGNDQNNVDRPIIQPSDQHRSRFRNSTWPIVLGVPKNLPAGADDLAQTRPMCPNAAPPPIPQAQNPVRSCSAPGPPPPRGGEGKPAPSQP